MTPQIRSVTQSCPTLCDPMDCSTPGFPVHHQLPELAETHVHQVGDAIQPSHPLPSPSPPALNLPSIRVFSNESALHIRWPKYRSFSFSISPSNEYSGLISFKIDWFFSPYSPRDPRILYQLCYQGSPQWPLAQNNLYPKETFWNGLFCYPLLQGLIPHQIVIL